MTSLLAQDQSRDGTFLLDQRGVSERGEERRGNGRQEGGWLDLEYDGSTILVNRRGEERLLNPFSVCALSSCDPPRCGKRTTTVVELQNGSAGATLQASCVLYVHTQ
jgi:hypothetical protein